MSRSTDASTGAPGDDDGRLDDAVTDDAEGAVAETDADDVEPDVDDVADEDADQAASGDTEADDVSDEDADVEPDSDESDTDEAETDEADESDAEAEVASAAAARGGRRTRDARSSTRTGTSRPAARKPAAVAGRPSSEERRGPIAAIVLFVRQVISELRKVVTPTARELGTYVAVVIVFVIFVMAYVGVIDLGVAKLVLWAFGG